MGERHSPVTELCLRLLGLAHVADTVVGGDMLRGISGGQRKRTTTGEMAVGCAPPPHSSGPHERPDHASPCTGRISQLVQRPHQPPTCTPLYMHTPVHDHQTIPSFRLHRYP